MKPKVIAPSEELIDKTLNIIKNYNLNTICFSSKCPNLTECFSRGVATFMILGNICSRNCKFCNVSTAKPQPLDKNEIINIPKVIKYLNLKYVVITSVDRDDLDDFGSVHFRGVIDNIKLYNPSTKIEILTPDFQGDLNALNLMVESEVFKLAHNIETTKKLHKYLKPKSDYNLSLRVLEYYSKFKITKSSIMVGFGETIKEIKQTFKDLKNVGVSQLTIGQYLQPTPKHYKVMKYYSKQEFQELQNLAKEYFESVVSGELVRSSYYADKL
jgi:lipoic acid synthetase